MTPSVTLIPVDRLHGDPANRPEKSGQDALQGLARTIRVLGVLNPLTVEDLPGRPGHYRIRAGHRRKAAAELAGLGQVPCIVRPPLKGADSGTAGALYAVVENFQRAAMSPVELARRLGTLRDGGMSQADIARFTGMADSVISYHLELLDADEATLARVESGQLPVGAVHEAVRATRAGRGPLPAGSRKRAAPVSWFNAEHRLAAEARALCVAAACPASDRIGKVACGPHWERAIAAAAMATRLAVVV